MLRHLISSAFDVPADTSDSDHPRVVVVNGCHAHNSRVVTIGVLVETLGVYLGIISLYIYFYTLSTF